MTNARRGQHGPSMDGRVLALEAGVAHLETGQAYLTEQVNEANTTLKKLVDTVGKPNPSQWQNLLTACGLLMMVLGALATPLVFRLGVAEGDLNKQRERNHAVEIEVARLQERQRLHYREFQVHAKSGDHPWGVLTKIQRSDAKIDALEKSLFSAERGARIEGQIEAMRERVTDSHHGHGATD